MGTRFGGRSQTGPPADTHYCVERERSVPLLIAAVIKNAEFNRSAIQLADFGVRDRGGVPLCPACIRAASEPSSADGSGKFLVRFVGRLLQP
jgi:hypothetical protein